ncbi:hypothetical protein ACLB2K_058845 [Fragaria x ananassa]
MIVGVGSRNISGSFLEVIEKQGWQGLWAGNAVNMIRIVPTQAIEFGTFEFVKRAMTSAQEKWKQTEGPKVQIGPVSLNFSISWISPVAVAGAAAGIASTLVCHPLEVLKDRLTVCPEAYPSIGVAICKIYKEGGIGSCYSGLSPTLIGMLPYSTCYYFMYEKIKKSYCLTKKKESLSRPEMLLVGALAGFTASTISFPLEVARKRLMVGAMQGKCPPHMAAALSEVIREEGLLGLYRGWGASCLKRWDLGRRSKSHYKNSTKKILILQFHNGDIGEEERKRIYAEGPDSGNAKRWVRQRFLGAGQFGTVFLACPAKPGSKMPPVMAVKSARLSESADLVKESRLLKKFKNCPFIIDTYGSDVTKDLEDEEELFNVLLEFAQRGALEDWIQKLKNVGLHEAHCVKVLTIPGLVLSYVAKIGDLGLAKKADKYNLLKRSDYINGTELYMSPEVSLDNIQEPPADIWALGCTVLQTLTGKEFWDVSTNCGEGRGVRIDDVPVIPEKLSNEAKDFLRKCFILNPLERYTAEMLLKHPFVCNSLPIWTVSRDQLVPRRRVCQEPAAIPLVGAVV